MKAKNAELEESLVRFSKYLQENDAKRARALKKAADERKLFEERSHEAEELVKKAKLAAARVSEFHPQSSLAGFLL